eukprot:g1942.t1
MLSHRRLAVVSTVVFIAMLLANGPLGGNIGSVSNKYNLCITPPAYAFSIWGLIYLGLIGFIVMLYVLPPARKQKTHQLFWVSCFLNAAWIVAFTHEWLYWQAVVIVSMTASLIALYTQLNNHWLVRSSIALYLGWLLAASTLGVSIVYKYRLSQFTDDSETAMHMLLSDYRTGIGSARLAQGTALVLVFLCSLFAVCAASVADIGGAEPYVVSETLAVDATHSVFSGTHSYYEWPLDSLCDTECDLLLHIRDSLDVAMPLSTVQLQYSTDYWGTLEETAVCVYISADTYRCSVPSCVSPLGGTDSLGVRMKVDGVSYRETETLLGTPISAGSRLESPTLKTVEPAFHQDGPATVDVLDANVVMDGVSTKETTFCYFDSLHPGWPHAMPINTEWDLFFHVRDSSNEADESAHVCQVLTNDNWATNYTGSSGLPHLSGDTYLYEVKSYYSRFSLPGTTLLKMKIDGTVIDATETAVNMIDPDDAYSDGTNTRTYIEAVTVVAGTDATLSVHVTDYYGNAIFDASPVVVIVTAGPSIDGPFTLTHVSSGEYTGTSVTPDFSLVGSYSLRLSVDGVTLSATETLTVTHGPVDDSESTISSYGSTHNPDGVLDIEVCLKDSFGNVIAEETGVAVNVYDATDTLVAGVALSWVDVDSEYSVSTSALTETGTYSITVTVDTVEYPTLDTALSVGHGAAQDGSNSTISTTSDLTLTIAKEDLTLTADIADQFNNPVTSGVASVEVTHSDPGYVGISSIELSHDGAGHYTTALSARDLGDVIDSPGDYTLTLKVDGIVLSNTAVNMFVVDKETFWPPFSYYESADSCWPNSVVKGTDWNLDMWPKNTENTKMAGGTEIYLAVSSDPAFGTYNSYSTTEEVKDAEFRCAIEGVWPEFASSGVVYLAFEVIDRDGVLTLYTETAVTLTVYDTTPCYSYFDSLEEGWPNTLPISTNWQIIFHIDGVINDYTETVVTLIDPTDPFSDGTATRTHVNAASLAACEAGSISVLVTDYYGNPITDAVSVVVTVEEGPAAYGPYTVSHSSVGTYSVATISSEFVEIGVYHVSLSVNGCEMTGADSTITVSGQVSVTNSSIDSFAASHNPDDVLDVVVTLHDACDNAIADLTGVTGKVYDTSLNYQSSLVLVWVESESQYQCASSSVTTTGDYIVAVSVDGSDYMSLSASLTIGTGAAHDGANSIIVCSSLASQTANEPLTLTADLGDQFNNPVTSGVISIEVTTGVGGYTGPASIAMTHTAAGQYTTTLDAPTLGSEFTLTGDYTLTLKADGV